MHDEPLRLIPHEWRAETIKRLGLGNTDFKVRIDGWMGFAVAIFILWSG